MPYKRTYRRPVHRRKLPAKNSYVRKLARREAYKAIAKSAEHKHADTPTMYLAQPDYNGLSSGVAARYPCFPTVSGTSDETYVGTVINPTWITFRGNIEANGDTYNNIRLIVVQWNKGSGVYGDVRDIIQYTGVVRAPFSPYNSDQKQKFRVLFDKTYTVNADPGSGRFIVPVHFNISSKKLRKVHYTDGSGTIENGGIYLYAVSDSSNVTPPILSGYGRTYFMDF